jgi:hypothetical protein
MINNLLKKRTHNNILSTLWDSVGRYERGSRTLYQRRTKCGKGKHPINDPVVDEVLFLRVN